MLAGPLAPAADSQIAEQVFSVVQVGVLLGLAQARAPLGFVFLAGLVVCVLLSAPQVLQAMLFYSLRLGLVVGFGLCLSGGLCFGSLLLLFALDFGVFGRVPGVEDLAVV